MLILTRAQRWQHIVVQSVKSICCIYDTVLEDKGFGRPIYHILITLVVLVLCAKYKLVDIFSLSGNSLYLQLDIVNVHYLNLL